MSLRWRIAAGLAAIAAVVSAFGATAAYLSTSSRLHDNVDRALLDRATAVNQPGRGDAPGPGGGNGFQRPGSCPPAGQLLPASGAQLVSSDGAVTPCIEDSVSIPVDATDHRIAASGGSARLRTVTIGTTSYRVLTVAWRSGGALQMARSLTDVDDVLASLELRLGVIGVIGIAGAALVGWLFARRLVRPVDNLRDVTEYIAKTQDLATKIPEGGSDEIGSLARSFTTMIEALETSRAQQQQLITDASHELRTPLTSLKTNAELLGRAGELSERQLGDVVRGVQLELTELTNLVTEIVELAADRASDDEPVERVRLSELAGNVVDRGRRRTGREINLDATGDDVVLVRRHMIERVVSNLLDNATKYSQPGTTIDVVVNGRRLEVRDRGRGISEADLPHVFDRFYRSVEARTEPGSGLGLAIVHQIVQRHGGEVWATAHEGGGAVVGFELPAPS